MSFFRKVSDSESSDSEEERMSDYEEDAEKKATTSGTPAKVSRFLKGSDSESSSEEESDDDSASDDDDSEEEKKADGAKKKQSKFLRGASDDSDSEEDVKKIVKSAKDKRVDEMDAVVRSMENAQRIDDWVAISKGECMYGIKSYYH
jgi:translation initiation factor 3 subunit C